LVLGSVGGTDNGIIQSGPEKFAQSLRHHNFAIVGNKITWFTP